MAVSNDTLTQLLQSIAPEQRAVHEFWAEVLGNALESFTQQCAERLDELTARADKLITTGENQVQLLKDIDIQIEELYSLRFSIAAAEGVPREKLP